MSQLISQTNPHPTSHTLELSAELSITRNSYHKQVPPVCGVVFSALVVTRDIGAEYSYILIKFVHR